MCLWATPCAGCGCIRVTNVEVLRSEFDAGGYDLVMSHGRIVRHIQFKTSMVGGKAASISQPKLMDKPSGCIIWIIVTPKLELDSYRWLGGAPGQPLPDIRNMRVAKHTKANAKGTKAERPDQRIILGAGSIHLPRSTKCWSDYSDRWHEPISWTRTSPLFRSTVATLAYTSVVHLKEDAVMSHGINPRCFAAGVG